MPRSSTRTTANEAQATPLTLPALKPGADHEPQGISKEVYDAVLARVAELEAEVAANKTQLAEAAKDVASSTAKLAGAADMTEARIRQLTAEKGILQADLVSARKDTKNVELQQELASLKAVEAHKAELAAAVAEEQRRGLEELGSANEKLVLADRLADAQTVKVAALERELAEERAARRTSPHSAKRQKKPPRSNWPRASGAATAPAKENEGEIQEAYSESAAAFLASEGGVPVQKRTRGPNKGKVDVSYESRPFQIEGCGAEDFFTSLNVTGKSGLHQTLYEMGYVWDIASFKLAAYNQDESKPCQFRDVLAHVQDTTKFTFNGEACATRKVWLAAHLWPNCTAVFDKGISKLTGNEQSLLKKYVTGINQVIHAYNAFMAGKEDFTPLLASAPPPRRKAGAKRAREEEEQEEQEEQEQEEQEEQEEEEEEREGEGEDEQTEQPEQTEAPLRELDDAMMDSDGAVTPTPRTPPTKRANDEEMPEAVSDDALVVD
jgi:hypothetical protein